MRSRLAVSVVLIPVLSACLGGGATTRHIIDTEYERIPCPPVAPELEEECRPWSIPDPRGRSLRTIGEDIEDSRTPHTACYAEVLIWRKEWRACVEETDG